MSEENVGLVRNWLDSTADAFNSVQPGEGVKKAADRYLTGDVVYEEDPVWPDAGTFHGRDATVRRFLEYRDLVHLENVAPGDVIDAGDLVLAQARIEMLGGDEWPALEYLWTYTVRVENGRIVHLRAWYDPDEAARAAGLSE
jgi:ketosteroid isomerase-like protein